MLLRLRPGDQLSVVAVKQIAAAWAMTPEERTKAGRAGGWRLAPASVGPLYGETIGIIGLGRSGAAVARRCQALGMRVIAYDPYVAPDPAQGVERVRDLPTLLTQSDDVSTAPMELPEPGSPSRRWTSMARRSTAL